MPKSSLFNVFAQSPLRPLQEHMAKVHQCAATLPAFVDAALAEDWELAASLQQKISGLEREADEMKKDLRLHLPTGLFLPVARSDILELLSVQDNVANRAKDIAGLMLGRQMKIPKGCQDDFKALINLTVQTSEQAEKAIAELDRLFEAGFRGKEVKLIEDMIHELAALEQSNDVMLRNLFHKLYDIENNLPAVDVMFIYKVIELAGELADWAERIGGRLQILLAR